MRRSTHDRDEAFCRLYRNNATAVYAFFAYAVSRETAEDLTATTFERALRSLHRYDAKRASERTWLLAIARNALTDHFRRERHRRTTSTDAHPQLLDELVAGGDPADRLVTVETLVTWLQQLGEREREVLALRFGADLSAREVSRITDLSEANVHQVTSRALRRLREQAGRESVSDTS